MKDLEFVMLTTGLFLSKEYTDVVNLKSCSDVGKIRVAASCAYWVIAFFRRVDLGNLWINYINWTMFLLDLWRVTVSSLKQSSFWILLPLVKSSCNWHSPRSALQKHLQFFWNIQASWREEKSQQGEKHGINKIWLQIQKNVTYIFDTTTGTFTDLQLNNE